MTEQMEAETKRGAVRIPKGAGDMLVYIQGTERGEPYGKIVSGCLRGPAAFGSLGELILTMDRICGPAAADVLPAARQSAQEGLREEKSAPAARKKEDLAAWEDSTPSPRAADGLEGALKEADRSVRAGAVLAVRIMFRENSSMQGSVRGRLTGGKNVLFKSALELMRMLSQMEL